MKKVGKLSLDELKKNVKVLTKEEQREFVGGNDIWRISGGYLYEVDGGTLFCGDDDRFVWFPGVQISTSWVLDETAYQYKGTIHVDEDWLESDFNIYDFAHEYGHYLQEYEMKSRDYFEKVVLSSLESIITDPENHLEYPYEKDATNRGYNHLYDQEYY